MSAQATAWVWENSTAKGNELLVHLAVADAANREGRRSCQSVATMAVMTKLSERTVQRALGALREAGQVIDGGPDPVYRTTVYDLPMGGDKSGAMGDRSALGGVTNLAPGGDTTVSPYPTTTQLLPQEPDAATAAAPALFAVPDSKPADPGKAILDYWWTQQNPRPAGKSAYHSGLNALRAVLAAGWEPKAVQTAALTMTPPLSIPRLEIALDRSRANGTGVRSTHDSHWQSGGQFVAEEGTTP